MSLKLAIYQRISRLPLIGPLIQTIRDRISFRKFVKRGTFSQHGEDLLFCEYFGKQVGRYVDIGASHPFRISNTYMLYTLGWRGVIVEPIPELCALHRKWRPQDDHRNIAISSETGSLTFYELVPSVLSTLDENAAKEAIQKGARLRSKNVIPTQTLSQVLETAGGPVDLLSVDAEGFDFQILQSNDWKLYRPRLIIFERNEEMESDSDRLLVDVGYKFYKRLGCNQIYEIDTSKK